MNEPAEEKKGALAPLNKHPFGNTHYTLASQTNSEATGATIEDAFFFSEPGELVPYMTEKDVLEWQIRRAALLAVLSWEHRSFAEVAESLGVTPAAISVAYTRLIKHLGWESLFRRLESRKRTAEAIRRLWEAKRMKEAA